MTPCEFPRNTVPANSIQNRRLGIFVCLAVFAGTGAAGLLECCSRQSFPGSLEARTTTVATNQAVRINEVTVKTGQSVIPGDALAQLIDVELENRIVRKRREIAEFEAEFIRSKAGAEVELAWRRRDLQTEIFEMQLKVAALSQEKLNKQVEHIAWKERLSGIDMNSAPLLTEGDHPFRSISLELQLPDERRLQAMLHEDAAAASAEAIATQIALCEQRLKKLEAFDHEIETKIKASSGIELAETRFKNAKQELEILEAQVKELTVVSPTHGTIGDVKRQSGELVSTGSTLVEILDETQPHVIAHIPSGIASKLQKSSKITLVFPMDQRRIGIVTTIPPQTTSVLGGSESFVAVKIEPAGKLWPKLAIGSNVKVLLQ